MPDNNKDYFAAPTKDELDELFTAPSQEELASVKSSKPTSSDDNIPSKAEPGSTVKQLLQDLKDPEKFRAGPTPTIQAGAAQGASLGLSDELGGAKDVAGDILSGKQGLEGLGSKWRQYQKQRESANKTLSEANPGEYLTGELIGGAVSVPFMPELGGAKLAEMAGYGGKAAKDASLLAKLGHSGTKMAIEGAPVGAVYGAGASEGDIEHPGQLAGDTASGAAMGSLGGLAIGAGAEVGKQALQGAGKLAGKYDFTRKLGESYNLGKEGINYDTSEGKQQVAAMSKEIPNEITNKIMEVDSQLGKAVGASLDQAEQQDIRINASPELEAATNELYKTFVVDNPQLLQTLEPKDRELLNKLNNINASDLSPIEARALKDTLYGINDKMSGFSSEASSIIKGKSSQVAKALDQSIKEQIPAYKDAAAKFADFRSKIPETILQPNLPADKRTKMLGNLKNKETDLYKGANELFGQAHLPGASTIEGPRAGLGELQGNLKSLEQSNPAAVKGLGGSAEDVFSNWKKKADQMAVLRQSQGVEPHEGLKRTMLGQIVGSGEGVGYNLANKAGKIGESIGQSAPVKASKKVFSAGNDQLMNLANQLKQSKSSQFFGESLEKALTNKDDVAKNAVLFKLLQIPEYRQLLNSGDSNEQR